MALNRMIQSAPPVLLLLLLGCSDGQALHQVAEADAEPLAQAERADSVGDSILGLPFDEAFARLDAADQLADKTFFREQWTLIDPSANLESSTASKNRLAVSVRLAELVQVHVPDLRDEVRSYLLGLSASRYPFHREAAARAFREASGRLVVDALFARAIDSDQLVSSAALESLRWKFEAAAMSGASATTVEDAQLIARNIGKLCADNRLPRGNYELCRDVVKPRL